jgi:hypothetical protein
MRYLTHGGMMLGLRQRPCLGPRVIVTIQHVDAEYVLIVGHDVPEEASLRIATSPPSLALAAATSPPSAFLAAATPSASVAAASPSAPLAAATPSAKRAATPLLARAGPRGKCGRLDSHLSWRMQGCGFAYSLLK